MNNGDEKSVDLTSKLNDEFRNPYYNSKIPEHYCYNREFLVSDTTQTLIAALGALHKYTQSPTPENFADIRFSIKRFDREMRYIDRQIESLSEDISRMRNSD